MRETIGIFMWYFCLELPLPAIITSLSNDKRFDVFGIHNSHANNTLTAGSNANQSFSGESKRWQCVECKCKCKFQTKRNPTKSYMHAREGNWTNSTEEKKYCAVN